MSIQPADNDSIAKSKLQEQSRKAVINRRTGLAILVIIFGLVITLVCELAGIWFAVSRSPQQADNSTYTTWRRAMDGMLMVYVPAGTFKMGSDEGPVIGKPAHTVGLDAFWIDQTDVTNAEYGWCVSADKCTPPSKNGSRPDSSTYGNPRYDNHPVVYVSWDQAAAYCKWVRARLPSEAEWEKAARGSDGRKYPWGETIDSTFANYGMKVGDTTTVCSYPKGNSPYGACDMAGNVWQWTADWYSFNYYENSPAYNPTGPASGTSRTVRGGSWGDSLVSLNSAHRLDFAPYFSDSAIGFRCASMLPPQKTTDWFRGGGILGFAVPLPGGD